MSNKHWLATYAGRSVAFLFISCCEPCRRAIPGYEALREPATRAGVELVLVSASEADATRVFVDELR